MRDHDSLLLTAGQVANPLVRKPGRVDGLEHLVDSLTPLPRRERNAQPVPVQAETDQVPSPYRHVRVKLDFLGNVADKPPAVDPAADANAPLTRRLESEYDPQQGRLARAIRSDQADELAWPDCEANVVKYLPAR
jgi:hypothetical protein